jgi:glycosyltransferase involved in cell wall biosynthesis
MKLSIILCTRNREHGIAGCLDSIADALSNASLSSTDAEIIVIDNRSRDKTPAILKEWAARSGYPVRVLLGEDRGPSAGRNQGMRNARGELIALTDDDCRLDKNHVKDLLRHDAGDSELVLRGGRIEAGNPYDLPVTIKTRSERQRWHLRSAPKTSSGFSGTISSCNMALRREVLQVVGYFDEQFGPGTLLPGGEDTDFIVRAYLALVAVEYVPDMTVYHHHGRRSETEGKRLMRGYMVGTGGLCAKYLFKNPSLCRRDRSEVVDSAPAESHQRQAFDLSQADKLFHCGLGAVYYVFGRVREMLSSRSGVAAKQQG